MNPFFRKQLSTNDHVGRHENKGEVFTTYSPGWEASPSQGFILIEFFSGLLVPIDTPRWRESVCMDYTDAETSRESLNL